MTKPRNYKQAVEYESSPEQVRNRVARNRARREAIKAGIVKKGDGKEIDHVVPLDRGGSRTAKSNTRVVPASENRSFSRTSNGSVKSQISKRERAKK